MAFDMEGSEYSEYQDLEWAVKLNRVSLKLMGLWPKAQQNSRDKLIRNLHVLVTFLVIVIGILIPAVHSLIMIHSDLMLVIDNLQFVVPCMNCAIKIIIFWWNKEAVATIINIIAEDWQRSKNVQERNMMIRRAESARIITTFGYCLMGLSYIFIVFLPAFGLSIRYLSNITDPGRPMLIQSYYMYDVTKTPQYEITYVVHSISAFCAFTCYVGIDNFLGLIVFHICGQLDILRHRFICSDKFMDFHVVLKSCVMDHSRLLRTIAVVEDTYNIILLTIFLSFGVLFAFYGFVIINLLVKGNLLITRLLYLLSNIINILGHMCLHCAIGEILMAQCDRIYYTVYNQKWYTLEPNEAKDLIPVIIKSRKPVYLTAGKIFPITMATFCSLVKTSAGYMSVLLGMSI
ncbi:PREDICTED: odorant receptor Or2-like [Vollenhovia emeryi]|uniref:odorant receptor Or2-like n=1 Tax=Vollenhovia emeryi TaxID=411798 RepID=UPI0005F3FF52|nr:PREDICTED: odorant receptor Or2-like [Vollenhovia emeryi]